MALCNDVHATLKHFDFDNCGSSFVVISLFLLTFFRSGLEGEDEDADEDLVIERAVGRQSGE